MIPRFLIFAALALAACAPASSQQAPPPVVSGEIPQHILFYQLFRAIAPAPAASEDLSRFGEYKLSRIRQDAPLRDDQVELLIDVAAECLSRTSVLDAKAQSMIQYARDRRVNPGGPPGGLIADLRALEEEKNEIIRQSLRRLQESLGTETFDRIAGALKPRPGSSFSARIPEDLLKPAPMEQRAGRPDFSLPSRQTAYEAKLPIKVMISAVDPENLGPKANFRADQPMAFKVALLNTANYLIRINVEAVMRYFRLSAVTSGMSISSGLLGAAFTPFRAMLGEIDLPSGIPLEVGLVRLTLRDQTVIAPGAYLFTWRRPLVFQPPVNEAETRLIKDAGLLALNSNTVEVTIVPE